MKSRVLGQPARGGRCSNGLRPAALLWSALMSDDIFGAEARLHLSDPIRLTGVGVTTEDPSHEREGTGSISRRQSPEKLELRDGAKG